MRLPHLGWAEKTSQASVFQLSRTHRQRVFHLVRAKLKMHSFVQSGHGKLSTVNAV